MWRQEIHKWGLPLSCNLAVGDADERTRAFKNSSDIVCINRDNTEWLVENRLHKSFDTLVIDEASSFKSYDSDRSKALRKARSQFKRVVALSATPSPNGLIDLFSQFRILDGGERLGRFIGQYRAAYFLPDKTNGRQVYSYKLRKGADTAIYEKIGDITISMSAADYLEMPELVRVQHTVQMTAIEQELYKTLKNDLVVELGGNEITAVNAAVLCGKLTQLANGFAYTETTKHGTVTNRFHDHKIDKLCEIIEQQCGQPVLCFYWYQADYEAITARLTAKKIKWLDLKSDGAVEKWNSGDFAVGLANPASCGHGLNLQHGGHCIVWYAQTWSAELRQQAEGRLYRQGQKSKTVIVHDLLTAGTIDTRINSVVFDKADTQNELIAAVKAEMGELI